MSANMLAHQVMVPLDRIAGLDGFVREWSVAPAERAAIDGMQPVPIREDFGLWVRRDPRLAPFQASGLRLHARVLVTQAGRYSLILNTFAGCRLWIDDCALTPQRPRAAHYTFSDLQQTVDLSAGVHDIVAEVSVTDAPPVFAARLLPADGVAQGRVLDDAGVHTRSETALFPGSVSASRADEAETFRYYNMRCSVHPRPSETWTTSADFGTWRDMFRRRLAELMPIPPGAGDAPLAPELVDRVEFDDHIRETVRITVEPGWRTDVYVLIPRAPARGSGPWPALLCLHGHGRGKDDLVGIDRGDPGRRAAIDALHEDYALRYVRQGFVTAAPGMRLLADRGVTRVSWKRRDPCDNGYAQATMCGLVPAALDAWDARRTLDLLASRPEVAVDEDGPRLGCVGLSYGGRATMNVTALDDRIRVAVVSGAMNTFQERLVSFAGCGSQFVPGLFTIGDTPEVLASIAPRPLLLELGSRDGTSPAIFAEAMARTLARAYELADAADRIEFDIFEGEHWFSGRLADPWLARWLT